MYECIIVWCLGMSVRGTAVPRIRCPGGHFAGGGGGGGGGDIHHYDTTVWTPVLKE